MAAMQLKFQQAEAALLDTIAFVPAEYDNYVFLSNLYNVAGQMLDPSYYEKAVAIADKGIEVEPFGPALRVQRARALVALNRPDEALKDAEFAVKMDPIYTEAADAARQNLRQRWAVPMKRSGSTRRIAAWQPPEPSTPEAARIVKATRVLSDHRLRKRRRRGPGGHSRQLHAALRAARAHPTRRPSLRRTPPASTRANRRRRTSSRGGSPSSCSCLLAAVLVAAGFVIRGFVTRDQRAHVAAGDRDPDLDAAGLGEPQ